MQRASCPPIALSLSNGATVGRRVSVVGAAGRRISEIRGHRPQLQGGDPGPALLLAMGQRPQLQKKEKRPHFFRLLALL